MRIHSMTPVAAERWGGIGALYLGLAYLAAIPYFLLVSDYPRASDAAGKVAAIGADFPGLYAMTLATYVVFGLVLGALVLVLRERLDGGNPRLVGIATAVGMTWSVALVLSGMVFTHGMSAIATLARTDPSQAARTWPAVEIVAEGLGGASGEILGGVWMLLACGIAVRTRSMPRALAGFGIAIGLVGGLSAIPALHGVAVLYGLLQMLWFFGLGLELLRAEPRPGRACARVSDAAIGGRHATPITLPAHVTPSEAPQVRARIPHDRLEAAMTRTLLVTLGLCLFTATTPAAELVRDTPTAPPTHGRRIRVEGAALGGLYESRDAIGAYSGRLGKVTCLLGRARVGVSLLDGFGRPHSVREGNSYVEMNFPLHVGVDLLTRPRPVRCLGGLLPEAYAEVVVGPWNSRDAKYQYAPNVRAVLGCGLGGECLGLRAELGYLFGRDAYVAGLQLHGLTFDLPF